MEQQELKRQEKDWTEDLKEMGIVVLQSVMGGISGAFGAYLFNSALSSIRPQPETNIVPLKQRIG